jgi:hypothetical protein
MYETKEMKAIVMESNENFYLENASLFLKIKDDVLAVIENQPKEQKDFFLDILETFSNTCVKYLNSVSKYYILVRTGNTDRENAENIARADEVRKITHDALIADCNVFARMLSKLDLSYDRFSNEFLKDRYGIGEMAIAIALSTLNQRN